MRGTVTSVESSGDDRAHVLPSGASITLHLEGENFSKSYSLKNPNERTVTQCVDVDEEGEETERHCRVGETTTEKYKWTSNLPPRFAHGDSVLVRLRYSAPRPGKPGTPTVTAPTGKSGALVVKWTAPANEDDDPEVRGYEVHVSPAAGQTDASGVTRTTGGSTTRLPVLLLEPNTAYNVRVRARTYLASGPWSDTAMATTNPLLQGANNPQVELDLNDVTKVKVGDKLYKRLKVTGMNNLHADAFPDRFEGYYQGSFVEFRVLDSIQDSYEYEDLTHGDGEGAFYAGALTIGEDGEVYHNFGYDVIAEGRAEGEKGAGAPEYGPLYLWLERTTGVVQIGSTANSRATALCVEIADDSNMVQTGRTCSTDGSAGHAVDRLTGRFVNVPQSHDGESEFTVRLAFVEDVGISPTSLREDALAASGGAVTQVQRVDDRSDLFEITVEPDSDEDVTITLSSSGDCGESGSICTLEEDPRKLDNSPTATVAGPILTASFQGLPSQHDGETAFSFRIAFSDEIATDAAEFRDHSVEVWGGEVTRAEPVDRRLDLWEVEVEPASEDMVMVSLKLTQSCAATGAVCTAGGRLLSVIPATMVPGPATWPVRVTGEARVGQTLTADSSNLSGRYGVQVTSMTYRWLADGARIPGANARTYKPDDDKQGQRISVMATYTDDRGNEETVISAPTDPLAARDRIRRATGLPLISGRALVGHTLTADTSLIIDPNGLENAVFHYFWEADDDSIPDATDSTYTPVAADVGKEITVIVAWVDDAGHGQNMTSQPTIPVMTAEAAAAVEFRKSLRVAANADGSVTLYWNAPDEDVTGYRILRHRHSLGELDPLVYLADTGSTATAYTDTGMVAGVPHNYRVQAIRDGVLGERTIQIKIFPVRKATNSPATGAPAISGTAQVGETLTADISGIADEDGLENVTKGYLWAAIGSSGKIGARYAYQWLVDGADSGSGDHHAGYDNTTYTLAEDDVGKAISVRVTFVDDGGHQETLTSAATDAVAALPQPNSPATGAPTIGGTAQVGETLTVDTSGITDEDGLDDSSFTHQWVREDSVMVANAARSYTPTDGDRGKSVKVRVSFTDDAGNPETRSSAQTATVEARANSPATGLPTISGTARVGETLTVDTSGIADADGMENDEVSFQWSAYDNATGRYLLLSIDWEGTYTIQPRDVGMAISVIAIFKDDRGNSESLESAPTETVAAAANPTVPEAPAHRRVEPPLGVAPQGSGELEVSWTRPGYPYGDGGSVITGGKVQWKEAADSWDTDADVSEALIPGDCTLCGYTIAGLTNGVAYTARVFATNAIGDSPPSDELTSTPTDGTTFTLSGITRTDYPEDESWFVVPRYTVTGAQAAITWSLSGDDSDAFSISTGGSLHFTRWGSYENPTDADRDNQYQVTVQASDGTNMATLQVVVVVISRGRPIINGDAQVGQPLIVDTLGITDADGLHNPNFTYQWIANDGTTDSDIAGATNSTYQLVAANAGKTIKVRVSFTDDAGNEETLSSAPTGAVLEEPVLGDGLPGAPRNLNATAGNKEITLSWDPPADNGNAPATRYRIEWRVDGKDYDKNHWGTARSASYTTNDQANLANGVKYFFRVRAGNGSGNSQGPYGPASEEVSATPTSGSAADLGTPVLSNTKTLHHGMVRLDWQDVGDAGWYVVQYYHLKGGEWLDLPAAGVEITFHGSSAVVSNLHGLSWLRVRAMSCDGASEWSQIEELYGTKASDWEGVPVPEVAEGDEIEPCPVVLGTPVLSDTEDLHHGMVQLDWEDIEDAGWYVVQYYHVKGEEWLDLPAEGVDIAFHGSSAVVSNLHGLSWLRVRAMSCVGASEWSQIEQSFGTKASDWEGVPVPEVAEGDEIEPCPEDAATPDNSPATGAPTISGTAQAGETLEVDTSGVADADGLDDVSFTYQWLADDVDISGATGSTYTLTDNEEGKAIKVGVSFDDDADNEETLTSAATDAVAAAPTSNSPATGAPTISGTARVGETLTANTSGIADADGLDDGSFAYQWLSNDGNSDTEIAGATGLTYTLADDDEGKVIEVTVSFTDDAGNEETLTSAATEAVAAAPTPNSPATGAPTITGTVQVGETLTANTSGIADADGLSNVQYEYQWLADTAAITGATAATYTLADADEGKAIKVEVTFTDDAGNGEALTSAATDAVAAEPSEPPDKPKGLDATATHDSVTLTWDDPQDDSITGYVILRRVRVNDQGGDFSELVADTESAATTYTDNTVAASTTYTYRIKAINEHGTSERSRWVHIDTPAPPVPDKPTGLEATVSNGQVVLTWDDPEDDSITGYVILRRVRVNDTGGEFSELVADTGTAATTYTDGSVAASTTYTYRIKAINEHGVSERSRWYHVDTPAAP